MNLETHIERHDGPNGEFYEVATVTLEGRSFTALGAGVCAAHVVGYLSADETTLLNCAGGTIGKSRVAARWKTPRSYISEEMLQVEVTLPDGAVYTGRCAGSGMLYRGKRKRTTNKH